MKQEEFQAGQTLSMAGNWPLGINMHVKTKQRRQTSSSLSIFIKKHNTFFNLCHFLFFSLNSYPCLRLLNCNIFTSFVSKALAQLLSLGEVCNTTFAAVICKKRQSHQWGGAFPQWPSSFSPRHLCRYALVSFLDQAASLN